MNCMGALFVYRRGTGYLSYDEVCRLLECGEKILEIWESFLLKVHMSRFEINSIPHKVRVASFRPNRCRKTVRLKERSSQQRSTLISQIRLSFLKTSPSSGKWVGFLLLFLQGSTSAWMADVPVRPPGFHLMPENSSWTVRDRNNKKPPSVCCSETWLSWNCSGLSQMESLNICLTDTGLLVEKGVIYAPAGDVEGNPRWLISLPRYLLYIIRARKCVSGRATCSADRPRKTNSDDPDPRPWEDERGLRLFNLHTGY